MYVPGGGARHGYRNSQWTVLAPTGTIAFMMDCDTRAWSPTSALVQYKQLWVAGCSSSSIGRADGTADAGYDEPADPGAWITSTRATRSRGPPVGGGTCVLRLRVHAANGSRSIH